MSSSAFHDELLARSSDKTTTVLLEDIVKRASSSYELLQRRPATLSAQELSAAKYEGKRADTDKTATEQPGSTAQASLRVGLRIDQVEPWQRFPYLETGYRSHGATCWQCFASMFGPLHNETVNAWTMVASTVAGALLLLHALAAAKPRGWDASPFWIHFLAQLMHFPASFGYHTFMPMSPTTAYRWRRIDLCLVIVLNIACNYSLTYFTVGRTAALALTALACVSGGAGMHSIITMQPGKPLNRTRLLIKVAGTAAGYYCVVLYRAITAALAAARQPESYYMGGDPHVAAALFNITALPLLSCSSSLLAPSASTRATYATSYTLQPAGLVNLGVQVLPRWLLGPEVLTAVAMLVCHGVGATVYATHWPQRQFPRVFDLCGFSHNLMHVFCFLIYVWGFNYMAILHSRQHVWFGLSGGANAA